MAGAAARGLVGAALAALAAPAAGIAVNAPQCATSITGGFTQMIEGVRDIIYGTDFCFGMWYDQWNRNIDSLNPSVEDNARGQCARKTSVVIMDFAGAASAWSAAAYNCGGINTGCAQQIFSTLSDMGAFGKACTEATWICASDPFQCTNDVFDMAQLTVLTAQQILTAVNLCAAISPPLPGEVAPQPEPVDPNAPEPVPVDPNAPAPEPTPVDGAPAPEPTAADANAPAPEPLGMSGRFFPSEEAMERRLGGQGPQDAEGNGTIMELPYSQLRQLHGQLSEALADLRGHVDRMERKMRFAHAVAGTEFPTFQQREASREQRRAAREAKAAAERAGRSAQKEPSAVEGIMV